MPPIVIGGLIAGVGAIAGAVIGNKGVEKAADATQAAADTATAESKRQFDIGQANQQPWLTTGTSALEKLSGMYGIGPEAGAVDPNADFYKSPDYQFRLAEGQKAGIAAASYGGSLDSGDTIKGAVKYAGNLASGEFSSYANRLARLSGIGSDTASNLGQQGSQYATNVGKYTMDQGNDRASSYLTQGQNYGNTVQGLAGIGSGLIVNNPQWFGGGKAAYNAGSGNWTPGPGGF